MGKQNTKLNKMKNLANNISDKKMIKEFGITEAFFFNGEFYITSNYELGIETINNIENELRKYND
jgi:hypothetical protein